MNKIIKILINKNWSNSIKPVGFVAAAAVIITLAISTLLPNMANAACPSVSTTYGTTTIGFKVPSTGTFYVWTRMKAASASSNSVWLSIDNSCYANVGDSGVSTTSWTWVNWQSGVSSNKLKQNLSAGSHTLKLVGREANVKVDKVILTTLPACVPSGSGSNCVNSSTVSTGTDASGSGSSEFSSDGSSLTSVDLSSGTSENPVDTNGTLSLDLGSGNSNDGQPTKIEVYLHGKLIATNEGSDINVDTTKLRNGTYTLTIKATYQSGAVKEYTQKIKVNNKLSIWKKVWYFITTPAYLINKLFLRD